MTTVDHEMSGHIADFYGGGEFNRDVASEPSSPISSNSNDDDQKVCKHCNKLISEGHAYELGEDRWHINCFRCSKCSNLLGINSEFLVVGTGELVCENCFYDCQVCGKKIGDLAILAGNQPYCADCFVCKHCKNRIDNLRYAKTSSGLYCMNCHEKVLQKKKRLDQEKRQRRQKRNSTDPLSVNSSRQTTPIFEKTLPSIPPRKENGQVYTHQKNSSSIASFASPFESEDVSTVISPGGGVVGVVGAAGAVTSIPSVITNAAASTTSTAPASTSNTPPLAAAASKRLSLNNALKRAPEVDLDSRKKPGYERKASHERKRKSGSLTEGKLTSQLAEYGPGSEAITLLDPPKSQSKKANGDALPDVTKHRAPISSRAANNRKMVYVDDDVDSAVDLETAKPESHTPKSSIFKFGSGTSSSPLRGNESSKIGKSLSIESPKKMLNGITRHKKAPSVSKDRENSYTDFLEPAAVYDHSRSSSDIINSYSETSTLRLTEEQSKVETELKSVKSELLSMNSKVSRLKDDIESLLSTKESLSDDVSELTLTMQKLRFQIEKERQALEQTRSNSTNNIATSAASKQQFFITDASAVEPEDSQLLGSYDSTSRNASENSISETEKKIDSSIENLSSDIGFSHAETSKPALTVATNQNFSVQPYSSSAITPTTEEAVMQIGQIESVQSAVKPKVKARFWRSKGFGKFQKDSGAHESGIKISAPVLQHLDDEAFNQMNNKSRVNGAPSTTPISGTNSLTNSASKGKGMTFLDKFSSSIDSQGTGVATELKSPIHGGQLPLIANIQPTLAVSLIEKATKENRDVPLLILTCVKYVEKHGLYSEGIYRKSGGTTQMTLLEQAFENVPDNESSTEELERALSQDVNVVSSVLKRYLRRLPEPVITHALYDQYIACASIKRSEKKIEKIRAIVAQLPKQHRLTLHLIAKHLNLISKYSESNFMNLHNLAIVFAPSLVRDLTGDREIADMVSKNDVTEFLVSNYRSVF